MPERHRDYSQGGAPFGYSLTLDLFLRTRYVGIQVVTPGREGERYGLAGNSRHISAAMRIACFIAIAEYDNIGADLVVLALRAY